MIRFRRILATGELMGRRSIGFPLTAGIILTLLTLTLGVGWQILIVNDVRSAARSLTTSDWLLLVFGAVFFLAIIVGLAGFCLWLVREMRLNQRQRAFLDAVTHEMKTPLAALRLYRGEPVRRRVGRRYRGAHAPLRSRTGVGA